MVIKIFEIRTIIHWPQNRFLIDIYTFETIIRNQRARLLHFYTKFCVATEISPILIQIKNRTQTIIWSRVRFKSSCRNSVTRSSCIEKGGAVAEIFSNVPNMSNADARGYKFGFRTSSDVGEVSVINSIVIICVRNLSRNLLQRISMGS